MDCALTSSLLFGYHLGTLADEERASVDEHLLSCSHCLRAYFGLKHQMDRGASAARPSPEVRLRLRRSVEEAFRPSVPRRAIRFLRRPIPLYQGAIGAAVAIAVAALLPMIVRADRERASQPVATARIDSSNTGPVSLSLYLRG